MLSVMEWWRSRTAAMTLSPKLLPPIAVALSTSEQCWISRKFGATEPRPGGVSRQAANPFAAVWRGGAQQCGNSSASRFEHPEAGIFLGRHHSDRRERPAGSEMPHVWSGLSPEA